MPTFFDEVRAWEIKNIPRFKNMFSVEDEKTGYECYSPACYVHDGLVTREIIDDIRLNKKNVLSVGSGLAYLELMIRAYGVPGEQITLSDRKIRTWSPYHDMNYIEFDMHKQWPAFDKSFQYVFFPSSVLLAGSWNDNDELPHLLTQANHIIDEGQVRMRCSSMDFLPSHIDPLLALFEGVYDIRVTGQLLCARKANS